MEKSARSSFQSADEVLSTLNPRNAQPAASPKSSKAIGGPKSRTGTTRISPVVLNPPRSPNITKYIIHPISHAAESRSHTRNRPRRQFIGDGPSGFTLNERRETLNCGITSTRPRTQRLRIRVNTYRKASMIRGSRRPRIVTFLSQIGMRALERT